jgi:hypothetical protein
MDELIEESLRDDHQQETESFRRSVMEKVNAHVETPPLSFPWKLLGISVVAGATTGILIAYFLW